MPEEEKVAVAEAPEETPTIETPPAEEKAVPPSDQEQPKEEGVSGDQKVADEAPTAESAVATILDRLEEAAKDNPDIAAELEKRRPKPTADVEEEKFSWELEKNAQVRTASWNQAQANSQRYSPQNNQQAVTGVFDQLNELMLSAATDLFDRKIEDPNRVQVDSRSWAEEHIMPIIQGAQTSAYNLAQEAAKGVVLDTLEKHPSHKYMSTEQRAQYQAAVNTNQLGVALKLQLDAAGQPAPQIKDIAQKATTKAQEDLNLITELNKAMETLGSNGVKPTGGAATSSQPKDEQEMTNWHAAGERPGGKPFTTAYKRALLAKQK